MSKVISRLRITFLDNIYYAIVTFRVNYYVWYKLMHSIHSYCTGWIYFRENNLRTQNSIRIGKFSVSMRQRWSLSSCWASILLPMEVIPANDFDWETLSAGNSNCITAGETNFFTIIIHHICEVIKWATAFAGNTFLTAFKMQSFST